MAISITMQQAEIVVGRTMEKQLVPMLHSSPGIGKTSLHHQLCEKYNLYPIDIRLATEDPVNMNGFISVNKDTNRGTYIPFDMFPIAGLDEVPEGYDGWFINFDELSSAPPAIQAAAYKIILERKVGNHDLHPNVLMMATGNLEEDNAVVYHQSTALQSRMVHFRIKPDLESFVTYALSKDIDHRIISYLQHQPDKLMVFDPEHTDMTFPCPRTWFMLNKFLADHTDPEKLDWSALAEFAGCIGEGTARDFYSYLQIYQDLVTIDQIKNDPVNANIPYEPQNLFAIAGSIAHHLDSSNLSQLLVYLKRLPIEFQVIAMQNAVKRNIALIENPEIDKWINELSKRTV